MTSTVVTTETMTGPRAWLSALLAMARKEFIVMLRYPVELVASFGQILLVMVVLTLAGLMFAPQGIAGGSTSTTSGVVVYGFVLFMFLSDTLWGIGYNVRREQKQGTLEQLYLSPASKFATLLARVAVTLVWTGLMCVVAGLVMSALLGRLPAENVPLAIGILALALSGTFGTGFAFAAVTLRIREAGQTLANLSQFVFLVICAPFFPFSVLPDWLLPIARLVPLAHGVDTFRSALLGFPPGFPELAPFPVGLTIVAVFGLGMPLAGYWLYRREENRARGRGSLSEY
jgi:ABC-2 type transport system permease protein